MSFYYDRLMPVVDKTVDALIQTEHMQNILHGTMPIERFRFQLKQNFNYLKNFCRCCGIGLSRCKDYQEMEFWYLLLKENFEDELGESFRYWMDIVDVTYDEMEHTTMGEGKCSYSSHELARGYEGDNTYLLVVLLPCTVLYMYFALRMVPECTLPEDNMYRHWLEFYALDWYQAHCARTIQLVDHLTEGKSAEDLAKLEEIFAISCNYEYLQWTGLYNNEETWPLSDIIPQKSLVRKDWSL